MQIFQQFQKVSYDQNLSVDLSPLQIRIGISSKSSNTLLHLHVFECTLQFQEYILKNINQWSNMQYDSKFWNHFWVKAFFLFVQPWCLDISYLGVQSKSQEMTMTSSTKKIVILAGSVHEVDKNVAHWLVKSNWGQGTLWKNKITWTILYLKILTIYRIYLQSAGQV